MLLSSKINLRGRPSFLCLLSSTALPIFYLAARILKSLIFTTETLEEVPNFFKLIISIFINNFEHILHLVAMFALLTLNCQMLVGILLF